MQNENNTQISLNNVFARVCKEFKKSKITIDNKKTLIAIHALIDTKLIKKQKKEPLKKPHLVESFPRTSLKSKSIKTWKPSY
jgi:hypothetical protein